MACMPFSTIICSFATPGFNLDDFMKVSPAVMFNFDAGHFFGSTGLHPNTILEKYHDRIFSVHIKDKNRTKKLIPPIQTRCGVRVKCRLLTFCY